MLNEFASLELLKIIRHASIGIAVVDLSGQFRFVNEAHALIHLRAPEDYVGLNFKTLSGDEIPLLEHYKVILEEFARGERETYHVDSKVNGSDGVEKWYSVESFLVRNEASNPDSLVVISHDITERKNLESKLRKVANRLGAIEKSDAIGVHYFVKDGHIKCPNDAFLAMAGVKAEDACKLDSKEFTPSEWQEQDALMTRRLYETETSVSFLKEMKSKSTGKTIPVSITSTRFIDDPDFDGVSLVSDLSELFDAREEAEEYRNKADLALGAASIGLWDLNPGAGTLNLDDRARQMLVLPLEGPIHRADLRARIAEDDIPKVRAALIAASQNEGQAQFAEFRIQTTSGIRFFRATGRGSRARPFGELRIVGTLIDVTETKLFEQRILESEERFRTLAETIPQIVFTADESGHVNYVNKMWFDFTGQRYTDGISRQQIRDALHPSDLPLVREKWRQAVIAGRAFEFEYRMKSTAGTFRWVMVRASPLLDRSGKTVRWFGSCTDIDNHRRLNDELWIERDQAQQANRMKSSFLANMSHEIRTPLGAILGFTELLADGSLGQAERNEYLGIISRNSRSLSRIVDDVLDLSKVEAGLLVLEQIPFCPRTLARDVVTLFSERARKKNLVIVLKIEDDLPLALISDPMRVRQIINNLLSNSLKFTEHGGVTIELKRVAAMLQLSVEDTGIGVSKDRAAALFQPFVQGDESMSRKHGGTGLGLHLSRKLAEALGGSLNFDDSISHAGSRFILNIPLVETSAKDADNWRNESVIIREKTVRDLDGQRILVVDDAADNRKLLERLLVRTGARIEFANDGKAAIQRALSEHFDLIFMDLQMPGIDGFEATKQIREHQISTPIVALTAHAVEEIRERCTHLGFNGFLTKPIDSESLMQVARELITKGSQATLQGNPSYQ